MPAGSKPPPGKRRPIRVLLVEDSQADALLLTHALERGNFDPSCERIDCREAMETCLEKNHWDLILADHSMPGFSAPEALELVKRKQLDIPFIIVSGHIDEDTATASMRAGAHDYVMKDRLARLIPAVERELREAAVRADLRSVHDDLGIRVEKRTADLKAANLKLNQVLLERRRLENELLEIAENERRRIGFDLHDDLGQKLTGLSLMAKGLQHRLANEGHPLAEEAQKVQELIEQAIHHTHDLAQNFSSMDGPQEDLFSALKELSARVKKMFALPCTLSTKGFIPEMAQDATVQLYKIAQEAISNAVKHGKATQVSIVLARNGGTLALTIKNDGKPFAQPSQPTKRMGLRIMNYRANLIGASLSIEANKSGTTVICSLPIKNSSHGPHRSTQHEGDLEEVETVGSCEKAG
jgi:signal transduction histidine kinase